MKEKICYVLAITSFFFQLVGLPNSIAGSFDNVPVKGSITMIDLGAKKCIPCKMMAPIIEKLEKIYAGKASIVFIDVWENRDQAQRFQISAIPTQVFFDKDGKEVYRHVGYMGEVDIVAQLIKMGVDQSPDNSDKS
ncbi:MAG: thioredoxin family protein [Proteobacteria bacterium]|nr:thioredoxin family protein [Pseudomonadota bacterium]